MSAKKTPTMARVERAHLEKELARAKETLSSQEGEISRLGEQLHTTERACDAEVAYWKKESERLQQLLVDARISAAVKK